MTGLVNLARPAAYAMAVVLLTGGTMSAEEAKSNASNAAEVATFGGGCFWCTEAVFQQLTGVVSVTSGYMGGHVEHPTYKQVCQGDSGHAEVVQIRYDPRKIAYEELLKWFRQAHDPTELNRQGNDVGTQYRSVIFCHTDAQKSAAEKSRRDLAKSGKHKRPIVTEVTPASEFYKAEGYHQDYYRQNPGAGYCRAIIRPKLEKLGLRK